MSASSRMLSLIEEPSCRRQWPRQPMLLSARLIIVSGERGVRIRDLSQGGARIEGAELPPAGTDVLLKRGAFEAFGAIAWVAGTHGGIEFDEPLDEAAMDALRGSNDSHRQPGFGRKASDHPRWSDGSGWLEAYPAPLRPPL